MEDVQGAKENIDNAIETALLLEHSTLDGLLRDGNAVGSLVEEEMDMKFIIIEEKNQDFNGKKLEDCEPQAVGEALAMSVILHIFHYVTHTGSIPISMQKTG